MEKFKKIVSGVIFLFIIMQVFLNATYLFRGIGTDESLDRENLTGLENEKIDMIYLGASDVWRYWQPLKAWKDCGFTSYNYATSAVGAEHLIYYLKESQKTQTPSLYVIGIRSFEYWDERFKEVQLRRGTDSLDFFSFNRVALLKKYFENRDVSEEVDRIPYYFDIAKYHTNIENLSDPSAWEFIDNNHTNESKGYGETEVKYEYFEIDNAESFQTLERGVIAEQSEELLRELLEYCTEEKLNVLFTVCPYIITKEEYARFNTIGDIIESYGFNYLNANDYYTEIGLDFTTDFKDRTHVNALGAEKYTEFLETYILQNYEMPNHWGDADYLAWDQEYIRFKEKEKENKRIIYSEIENAKKGVGYAEILSQKDNFSEWYQIAKDSRYALLITKTGDHTQIENISVIKILKTLGIDDNNEDIIRIIDYSQYVSNRKNIDGSMQMEGKLGRSKTSSYEIKIVEAGSIITVDEVSYTMYGKGIHIVVYDNHLKKVVNHLNMSYEDETLVTMQ